MINSVIYHISGECSLTISSLMLQNCIGISEICVANQIDNKNKKSHHCHLSSEILRTLTIFLHSCWNLFFHELHVRHWMGYD